MIVAREQVVNALREALCSHPEVELALLFGSVARDHTWAESDVDVAVQGRAVDVLGLAAELGLRLGVEVDVVSLDDDVPIALLSELLRDAICVHECERGAHATFRSRAMLAIDLDGPLVDRMNRAWLAHLAHGAHS